MLEEYPMEVIGPFIAEKVLGRTLTYAGVQLLGPEAEREINECIGRSVSQTLELYSDDPDLQNHLESILTGFVRQGGLELFFLPNLDELPDVTRIRKRFSDCGYDPDTLPEDFDTLTSRVAVAFTKEIAEAAQSADSALFNVVSLGRIAEIQASVNLVLHALDSLVDPVIAGETRADLRSVVEDLRATREDMADLKRLNRRSERVPNAKALLDGPIRALRLQGELNTADRHADRYQAAESYGRIAASLSEKGYEFHAHLMRQKHAEALAEAGAGEEAFLIWLNEAAAELESGRLWISSAVVSGIDTHRASMPSSLQARADAVEALEGWNEYPEISIRVLKRVLDELVADDDPASAEVAVWLGEALAVDGTVEGVEFKSLVTQFEALAGTSTGSTSIRLRLLLAEATGEWSSLAQEVATDALSAEQAGLVLCRHGRWLALHGRAEEAISAYRQAIDHLTEADLLGDTANALRSISMIEERYIGLSDSLIENFELAKLVSNEASRFRRHVNARNASFEALHQAREGKHGALPDACRSARRYLWEARISGSLSSEADARRLVGDVMVAAGKQSTALANYILAGEVKKATKLSRESPLIDVHPFLDEHAPWIVGTALAVLAVHGDYWSSDAIDRLAPRLIDLTTKRYGSYASPEVHVEAWAALASITVQLSDHLVDQALGQLEPLIEREEGTYTRMDESLLNILVQIHRFKPSRRADAAVLIAKCIEDYSLMQRIEGFLISAVGKDELLRNAVITRADSGNRIAKTILAAAEIDHGTVHEEAKAEYGRVLEYEVGVNRADMVVSDNFRRAAVFSHELSVEMRDSLATHLLAIASDTMSPEAHRAAAAEALAILGNEISDPVGEQVFDVLLSLVNSEPSDHPIDRWTRDSQDALSRFSFNFGLSLSIEACKASGRFVSTSEQAARLLGEIASMWQASEEATILAACQAILAIQPNLRPPLSLSQLAEHPMSLIRRFAVALWADSPSVLAPLADRFAVDSDRSIRKQLAKTIPKIATQDKELAQRVIAVLAHDPSALVRAIVEQNASTL
jgi:hypothetical protein